MGRCLIWAGQTQAPVLSLWGLLRWHLLFHFKQTPERQMPALRGPDKTSAGPVDVKSRTLLLEGCCNSSIRFWVVREPFHATGASIGLGMAVGVWAWLRTGIWADAVDGAPSTNEFDDTETVEVLTHAYCIPSTVLCAHNRTYAHIRTYARTHHVDVDAHAVRLNQRAPIASITDNISLVDMYRPPMGSKTQAKSPVSAVLAFFSSKAATVYIRVTYSCTHNHF